MTVLQDRRSRLIEALQDVEDPEIPVSVVDLGLIVDLREQQGDVQVDLTLTSMGCPGLEMIVDDIRARLLREPGVRSVRVDVVWDPIWTKERISDEGKMQLREMGISL